MANPAHTIARRIINIVACIAPGYTFPRQTASKSTQTSAQIASIPIQTASKWTQVSENDLPALRSQRSSSPPSRIPRLKKKLNMDSVQTSRVTKRWSKGPKRVTRCKGLYNPQNSCYMNSVLQCLFNMPEFVCYLDGLHNEVECAENDIEMCVVCALKAVLEAYTNTKISKIPQNRNGRLAEAIKLRLAFSDSHPLAEYISEDRQGDPYVYLQYLLAQLEACEKTVDIPKSADMFKIEARTEWECEECGNMTITEDERAASGGGVGLSLNIQEPAIESPMLAYMRHNEFKTRLQIRCESDECVKRHGLRSNGLQRTRTKYITKSPEILIVHLHPGAMSADMVETKIDKEVDFEEYVNLGEFTESGYPVIYQLQGVVAHGGKTLSGGHYIAAVREPDGKKFCSINDQAKIGRERGGIVAELQWPRSFKTDFDPYVLFYTKI